jgi:formylglycine-generating enzyme required for sulfatase activity
MVLAAVSLGAFWNQSLYPKLDPGLVPVTIDTGNGQKLFVARHEVTIAQWQLCFDEGGCSHLPKPGFGATGSGFPVTGLNWFDVNEYVAWASQRSGRPLRLPTLAEWNSISHTIKFKTQPKLFSDPRLAWAANYGTTATSSPQLKSNGSFSHTPDGVADLDGNVWEWTATCASKDLREEAIARCPAFVAAGEHEAVVPVFIRDPATGGCATGMPPTHLGFRLVADSL